MSFREFEKEFMVRIEKNKSCTKLIDSNKEIINRFFSDKKVLARFIRRLNIVILKLKKFSDIEKSLKHPAFESVLKSFCESDILIQACKTVNKKAIKWLLTMNINVDVQDRNGKTALMYAVENYDLEKEVETLLRSYNGDLEKADSEYNTALFHAAKNTIMFNMIANKTKDFTHTNIDNDSILTYVSKMNKSSCFETIVRSGKKFDPNHINDEYKTALLYLVEYGRFNEIKLLNQKAKKLNINFHNMFGESVVSIFTNVYIKSFLIDHSKMVEQPGMKNTKYNYIKSTDDIKKYGKTINDLIELGTDFNVPIDGDGNTALMFFLLIKDYVSALNLLRNCKNLDLSILNKYGVSATLLGYIVTEDDFKSLDKIKISLTMDISHKIFMETLLCNKTFDFNYLDQHNNNLLNYAFVRKDKYCLVILKNIQDKILNKPNNHGETSLIIATKLGLEKVIYQILSTRSRTNINHKDELGNTALHYAVMTRNILAVYILMAFKANPKTANNKKLSSIKLAQDLNDNDIIEALSRKLPRDKINNMCILLPLFRDDPNENKMETIKLSDEDTLEDETSYYKNEYKHLLNPPFVCPYNRPKKILSIQRFLSDGYTEKPSENKSAEIFEEKYGSLFELDTQHLFIR